MQNKFQNSECAGENCNHERNQKKKDFPTNELTIFLRNFLIKLKLHAVCLYYFL